MDEHGRLLNPAVHGLWGEVPGWYHAEDLDAGDWLRTPTGEKVRVVDVRTYTATTQVHNLTINGVHTYYVLAGTAPVLVHNKGGKPAADDFNQARNQALDWLIPRGFKAEKVTLGKFGAIKGRPVGTQTVNGKVGFRIEFDERSGAHINV